MGLCLRVSIRYLLTFCVLPVLAPAAMAATSNSPAEVSSIAQVLALHQDRVTMRLEPRFRFVGASWPPQEVALLAFKDVRRLELWARSGGVWRHIRDYRIKGMSGRVGPKLREGDLQVPEGFYRIEKLNPNSAYHLSLKLDYPNSFDRERAVLDGRNNLGGDIYIHGRAVSQGCLAIGDNAIEELFVLTALLGTDHVSVLISPQDFRSSAMEPNAGDRPDWIQALYGEIRLELARFPLEKKGSME